MRAVRCGIIIALTIFCLVLVCGTLDIVPAWFSEPIKDNLMSSVGNFPFLKELEEVIIRIIVAIHERTPNVRFEDLFKLDSDFVDQSFALIIVSLLGIAISRLIGHLLYAPVYPRSDGSVIIRFGLYASNELVSILAAWLIYQFLFADLFKGFVLNLPRNLDSVKGWIYYGVQAILSLGLVWCVLSFIAVGMVTGITFRKVIMPIFGSVLKTICFDAAIAALVVFTKDSSMFLACFIICVVMIILSALIWKITEYYQRY